MQLTVATFDPVWAVAKKGKVDAMLLHELCCPPPRSLSSTTPKDLSKSSALHAKSVSRSHYSLSLFTPGKGSFVRGGVVC